MKFLKSLVLLSLISLSSCYRIHHEPYGTMHFSVSDMDKAELITVLDSFATDNALVKIQEGGERILSQEMKQHVHAIYENSSNYQFAVQNFLNEFCYSSSSYDFDKNDHTLAEELSKKLKSRLESVFNERITFYVDQYCKQAI
ncbi:hypothetical protein [Alteromonas sp. M12]|uniref:hypothetical protein n=1 Tax=Alteromonas sp. M12 TaxID=3135644 RepID=UPI00319EB020